MTRESTLQAAMDLHSAHETLARILDIVRYSGANPVKIQLIKNVLEDRHPWLFTDDSSLTQSTAAPKTMAKAYAPPNSLTTAETTGPHD